MGGAWLDNVRSDPPPFCSDRRHADPHGGTQVLPYRVLDLSDERGQLCGRILADLGADVVLVEPPGGSSSRRLGPFAGDVEDPDRSLFHWSFNRGKRSAVLDLDDPADRQVLLTQVAGADVLIESWDPGRAEQLGLGHDVLAAANPALVH